MNYHSNNRSATPSEQLAAQQRMCEAALRNPVAEHQFIACLLARPSLIDDARTAVPPFYLIHDGTQALYQIMLDHAAVAQANGWPLSFDRATLVNAAHHQGRTGFWDDARNRDLYEGHSAMREPTLQVDTTWQQAVHSVRETAHRVRVYRQANLIARAILDGQRADATAAQAIAAMSNLASECGQRDIRVMGDGPLVADASAGIRPTFLPWSMRQLGGFCPSTLTMLCARTGAGKSSFLMAIALDVAIEQGIPVLLMDDEMTEEQLRRRAVSNRAHVNDDLIRDGIYQHDATMVAAVEQGRKDISNPNLLLAPIAGRSHAERIALMETFRRRYVDGHPQRRGLILFDYLKLPSDSKANEWTVLGNMANELKQAAIRLELPIVSAVQANRIALNAEQADVIEKGLAFIAGSDRIAHVADAALLLRDISQGEQDRVRAKFGLRTDIPQPTSPRNLMSFSQVLHPLKNRNGDTNTGGTPLHFHRGQSRYTEMAYMLGTSLPSDQFGYVHDSEFLRKSAKPGVAMAIKAKMPQQQPVQAA